jgi:hypothetical protein
MVIVTYLFIGLIVALSFTPVGNFACNMNIKGVGVLGYTCPSGSNIHFNHSLSYETVSRIDYWYPIEEPCLSVGSVIKTVLFWPVVCIFHAIIIIGDLIMSPIKNMFIELWNAKLCWWP